MFPIDAITDYSSGKDAMIRLRCTMESSTFESLSDKSFFNSHSRCSQLAVPFLLLFVITGCGCLTEQHHFTSADLNGYVIRCSDSTGIPEALVYASLYVPATGSLKKTQLLTDSIGYFEFDTGNILVEHGGSEVEVYISVEDVDGLSNDLFASKDTTLYEWAEYYPAPHPEYHVDLLVEILSSDGNSNMI